MQRTVAGMLLALVAITACRRGGDKGAAVEIRPLSSFATQRLIVTPTGFVRSGDTLGWVQGMGGPQSTARKLDSAIATVLTERGLSGRWILPADLVRAFERNRTYATDPYQFALTAVRVPSFTTASRYGEPLSSQLRTMIALHEEARFVMLPIELRFERDGARTRGILRAALVDPRQAHAVWVGDIRGDAVDAPARALATVAARLADMFAIP